MVRGKIRLSGRGRRTVNTRGSAVNTQAFLAGRSDREAYPASSMTSITWT